MEAIIDAAIADGTTIDAVLAENDSTALGVAAALTGKNYDPYPPVSGQDGDPANLNNVAKGLQYVDVWKNANELGKAGGAAARSRVQGHGHGQPDAAGRPDRRRAVAPDTAPTHGQPFTTPGGNTVNSFILKPTPLTAGEPAAGRRRWLDHQGRPVRRRGRRDRASGLPVTVSDR